MIALSPATAQFAMHYFTLGVGGGCSFFCVDWFHMLTSILRRQRDLIGARKRHSCLGEESADHNGGAIDSD